MRLTRRLLFKNTITLIVFFALFYINPVQAAKKYSPSDVYAGIEYANRIIEKLFTSRNIGSIQMPQSKEKSAQPMHVYELHVSVLNELYHYAIKHKRRPPPLAVSTPIKYTPTDVYYLTQLVIDNIEDIYKDEGGAIDFSISTLSGKTPAHVYQELFKLYYNLNRLNGKEKVSPSEVYSHIYRAKEDLQYSLLTISKRLDKKQQYKKRLLVTATYGMHPDGTAMTALEKGKNPGDVMVKAFEVRNKLNVLRKRNNLPEIEIPSLTDYAKIKPIDVFLQAQFIIAELNLLKMPLNISSTTNSAKPVTGKSPSDVFQEIKHVSYMLDRLIDTL